MIQDILPKQFKLKYKTIKPEADDSVFVFRGTKKPEDRALIRQSEDGHITIPTLKEIQDAGFAKDESQLQYLFAIDDKEYYFINNGGTEDIQIPGYDYVTIRTFCDGKIVDDMSFAGMTAYHLFFWYRDNTCCGRCGKKLVPFTQERALQCPSCGNLVFPKLMPAVIIALRNGDNLLVSRYKGREYKGFALLAGFCEVGESLEQTVAREVEEEVGLRVKNITYFGSQPWGLDSNLLVGYYCDVDGSTDIRCDEEELATAEWLSRSNIPEAGNTASLTWTMIEAFRNGEI